MFAHIKQNVQTNNNNKWNYTIMDIFKWSYTEKFKVDNVHFYTIAFVQYVAVNLSWI
jgi:hypothetical protein